MDVAIDTNILVSTLDYSIDPLGLLMEYEVVNNFLLLSCIKRELVKVLRKRELEKVLKYLEGYKKFVKEVSFDDPSRNPDNLLLEYCAKNGVSLYTLDKYLIKRAKRKGIVVFTLHDNYPIRI